MTTDKAARIAAEAEALYKALKELLAMAEGDQVTIDYEYDCRDLAGLERDGALPDEIQAARAVLRRIEE